MHTFPLARRIIFCGVKAAVSRRKKKIKLQQLAVRNRFSLRLLEKKKQKTGVWINNNNNKGRRKIIIIIII